MPLFHNLFQLTSGDLANCKQTSQKYHRARPSDKRDLNFSVFIVSHDRKNGKTCMIT